MRTVKKFPFSLTEDNKKQFLHWAQQYEEIIWLDGNEYPQKHITYKAMLAVDAFTALKTDAHHAFNALREYQTTTNDWIFGYLSYDLKNDVEKLHSHNFDGLNFPDLYFFQPKKIFLFSENEIEVCYLNLVADEIEHDWKSIFEKKPTYTPPEAFKLKIQARTSKKAYLQKVNQTLQHIKRGDIYEANICQEFFSEDAQIHPMDTFTRLNEISRPPFSVFLKLNTLFACSASPERYIKKTGSKVISQPIKGTAKRLHITQDDEVMAHQLANDPKERSENIMITDLVRNDLSRIAEKGSVTVEELCAVYTFKQVHQLVSTISGTLPHNFPPVEVLRNTFPMGSMTGAPKVSAMQIIENIEDAKRGLYSGTIGYIAPSGDFDFNVVIRSILYNASKKYVSFSVGSAITINSLPHKEYEECLLKAKAMRHVLNETI